MKKVFYFSLAFLVLVLVFLGAYNFAFRSNVNSPVADSGKKPDQTTPPADTPSAFKKIGNPINEDVMAVVGDSDGTVSYYSFDDQALKKATAEGKDKTVLLSNLPGQPSRIVWSPQRDQALLLLSQSAGQPLWYSANFATKALVPLKPTMARLAWDNLGDKILYQFMDPKTGVRTLNLSDPDGSHWSVVANLGTQDSFLTPIPQSAALSFWNKPNAQEKTIFESASLSGQSRKTLLTDKFGADFLWSPDGTHILVSTSVAQGGNAMLLNIMNANGGEFQNLSVPTFVSKTVWAKDNRTVYYALPGSLPSSAVLPNDYAYGSLRTADTFWKLDTQTGKKSRLVDLKDMSQPYDSADLFLSPAEDALFFTDRITRRVYRIDF